MAQADMIIAPADSGREYRKGLFINRNSGVEIFCGESGVASRNKAEIFEINSAENLND
jgi:hypothetical protein